MLVFNKSLSIVIPAYNEEENIVKVVEDSLDFLKNNFNDYEVIIVDDGSTDATSDLLDKLEENNKKHIRVFHHRPNKGYGAALNTGLFNARCDLVFYTDSDNQFDITQIKDFMPLLDEYDIAVGYRHMRKDARYRLLVSKCYNKFVSFIFGIKVRDVNCSFKLFKNQALKKLCIETKLFFIDAELMARAYKKNLKITERPVKHFYRDLGSTKVNIGHVFTTLGEVLYVWWRINFIK